MCGCCGRVAIRERAEDPNGGAARSERHGASVAASRASRRQSERRRPQRRLGVGPACAAATSIQSAEARLSWSGSAVGLERRPDTLGTSHRAATEGGEMATASAARRGRWRRPAMNRCQLSTRPTLELRCSGVPAWRGPAVPDRHAARSRRHSEDPRAPGPRPLGAESRPGPTRVQRRRALIAFGRGARAADLPPLAASRRTHHRACSAGSVRLTA